MDWTLVPRIRRWILNHWTIWEVPLHLLVKAEIGDVVAVYITILYQAQCTNMLFYFLFIWFLYSASTFSAIFDSTKVTKALASITRNPVLWLAWNRKMSMRALWGNKRANKSCESVSSSVTSPSVSSGPWRRKVRQPYFDMIEKINPPALPGISGALVIDCIVYSLTFLNFFSHFPTLVLLLLP